MIEKPDEEQFEKKGLGLLRLALYVVLGVCVAYIGYDFFWGKRKAEPTNNQKLVITGHNQLTKEEIIEILDIKKGSNLQDYSFHQLSEKLKGHPRILDATITRRSKELILLNIVERRTGYVAHTPTGFFELDEKFFVLAEGEVRDTNAVIISGAFSLDSNNRMGTKFRDFAKVIHSFLDPYPELRERISEVHLSYSGEVFIYISDPVRLKVIMGSTINKKQIRKLYSALAYFENHKSSVNLLDLRGDDAVYY
jgi:hypothetical protein